ncbi:unnamed protein product [Durusdinium trenchii]|uniref:IRG-type G domain-containing protein n=1 Tax=Durusdinium trenchii TaxID=1381693 RepID=A0ABP0IXT5_9DINO
MAVGIHLLQMQAFILSSRQLETLWPPRLAMSELQNTLGVRRSTVERCGETWESEPQESAADAKSLPGVKFGSAPHVADWLRQKAREMPEEDLAKEELTEALLKLLAAPQGRFQSSELLQLQEVSKRLAELQQELVEQRDSLGAQKEELAQREAELKAQQEALEAKPVNRDYPIPSWLTNSAGTLNVAVVGNSGVGKSLLINKMRRLKPGSATWAPTGVKETTLRPTLYTFPGIDRVRLWDLPGAGTPGFPKDSYLRDMGLRYFDSVLIVTANRFTSTEVILREELEKYDVPYFMVRTKIDLDVWNNKEDNRVEEAVTLKNIRDELACHGVNRVYLVSSREPDRYDMPALLADAFPGVRDFLDASSFLFTGGESDGWGESWSMPVLWSAIIAGIQGQWRDALEDLLYVVDGTDVHITRESDGQTASIALTEHDDKVWLQETWYIDMASVGKARESTELRWIPTDISNKPRVWRWCG